MIDLPNVTLIIAETRAHELGRLAVEACLAKARFADVLIYTDRPELIQVPGARYLAMPNWPDKVQAGRFYYTEAMRPVQTSHALLIEWDGGINDPSMWRDDFLAYDYIGALWPMQPASHNVGNGGFLLMSKRLADHIYSHKDRMKITTDCDISVRFRGTMEAAGFVWAPPNVANDFSFEGWRRGPTKLASAPKSFGYHGAFNWPVILDREELIARARVAVQTDFVVKTGKWAGTAGIATAAPWLHDLLGTPAYRRPVPVRPRPTPQLQPPPQSQTPAYARRRPMTIQQQRELQLRGLKA